MKEVAITKFLNEQDDIQFQGKKLNGDVKKDDNDCHNLGYFKF